MTPLLLMAKAADIAERYGPAVVDAWRLISQTLRSEHPELNETPIPDAGAEMDQAREGALRREAQAKALKEGRALDDPDDTEDGNG